MTVVSGNERTLIVIIFISVILVILLRCWERGEWRVQVERRGWLDGYVTFI